jgi:hypothetical protein
MATVLRAASALTGSYVAYDMLNTGESNQLNVYVTYVKGDETSCDLIVEVSPDLATWSRLPTESAEAGVVTVTPATWRFTASATTVLQIPCTFNHARISAKAVTGTPTGTLALSYEEDTV